MYEAFYHLRAKPFSLNPDPTFFFGSKGHKRAMSYLEYGLHQGEGFIVITGEVGAGKTTLVRNLFRKLDTGDLVAAQLVSTQLDADDTLRMVAASFGVPHEEATKAVLLKRVEAFLVGCREQGKRALLVVDEAQNLTPRAVEELRMLSNYQSADRSLLQTFLLGQPEFRITMQSPDMTQLRQRVIASYHLGPLDAEDTRGYIQHRLQTVGWDSDPSFNDEAFAEIFAFTGGIPRKINTLCDRLMLMGYIEEKHAFGVAEVKEVIADIQREMSYPEHLAPPPNHGSRGVLADDTFSIEIETKLARMDERISDLERSVTTVLKLLREILSLASVRRLRNEDHQ
ncbi:MAG: XrtA/PEP-CTERM system-associated ATPase [Pseudomonadota bacterium]